MQIEEKENNAKSTLLAIVLTFVLIFLVFGLIAVSAQTKCLTNNYYSISYDTTMKAPIRCKYVLFKGGGNVSRATMKFMESNKTSRAWQFSALHLDRGHLCNFEDMAATYQGAKSTMSMYNVLPMTISLNRGVWKKLETQIRKLSLSDTITIVCGGTNFVELINNLYCPKICYKTYFSHKNKHTKYFLFSNAAKATIQEVSRSDFFEVVDSTEYFNECKQNSTINTIN